MFHAVNQNNAVNLYECYFENLDEIESREDAQARTIQCFRYPFMTDDKRPANHLSFSSDGGETMATSYTSMQYQSSQKLNAYSCIWNVGRK